ncbi:MMP9 [Lepeophtheirus salmonis]|uniref:MMP9 n=1 Tax=Lepeophtheirus salmonis TaxID=72036 RepID=A0A7R8CHK2_LEPSM|nr:MMP9 [Lepeophtheirus salmonis]CAF2824976.1 MMP9 [Lepeophtheirus salmonis]
MDLYSSCTTVDNAGFPWCATSVYSTGHANNYGACSSGCPVGGQTVTPSTCATLQGEACIFPFGYNDVSYSSCTTVGDTQFWCATSLYSGTNEALNYGYCNSVCQQGTTVPSSSCRTLGVSCTNVDNGGVDWCATSKDSTGHALGWGNCDSSSAC